MFDTLRISVDQAIDLLHASLHIEETTEFNPGQASEFVAL
jgi:hypothetical protein